MSLLRFFLAFCLMVVSAPAWSAASCTIVVSAGAAFGAYDPQGANATSPLSTTGTISVYCNGAAKNTIILALDQGANPAAGSTCALPRRQMAMGTSRLRYDLYKDAAASQVWGCTAATYLQYEPPNGSFTSNFTVHARVPAGQNPAEGLYSDTVGLTVTF